MNREGGIVKDCRTAKMFFLAFFPVVASYTNLSTFQFAGKHTKVFPKKGIYLLFFSWPGVE
jgi:hypothetical protein